MQKLFSRTLAATTLVVVMSFAANAEAKLKIGQKFPAIQLKTLDGKAFSAKTLNGKIVLVDFWASWCEPCKISMPFLQQMAKKYKGKIQIVGVNVDDDVAAGKAFLKENPAPDITFLADPKKELVKKVGVATMPSSFMLDRKGNVAEAHEGFTDDDKAKVEEEIKKMIKSK